MHAAFELLPLGCIVGGQILIVHGGIGHGNWSLSHLRRTRRPGYHRPPQRGIGVRGILYKNIGFYGIFK